jgi:hypothetical protein
MLTATLLQAFSINFAVSTELVMYFPSGSRMVGNVYVFQPGGGVTLANSNEYVEYLLQVDEPSDLEALV